LSTPRALALAALGLFSGAAIALESLDDLLEGFRARHRLPGLAALVIKAGKVHAEGAAGIRKAGAPERMTARDQFHIGSNTKAMTATLAAILVEEGRIGWHTTLARAFPEIQIHPALAGATLELLLLHRAGTRANTSVPQVGALQEQRIAYLKAVATGAPEHFPGAKFLYSNAGYIIAGAMLERATGIVWEKLMRERLFAPLGMSACGFGPPPQRGGVDNPWGHQRAGSGFQAFNADNPPYLGPAGTVHCTLQDYARFALLHMQRNRLLGKASFEKLQTPPPGEEYAFGWGVVKRGWAGGTTLSHAGSNTMNYFVAWLAPARAFGVIAAANLGGDDVAGRVDEVVGELIRRLN